MNVRPLRLAFSAPLLVLALLSSGCATTPQNSQQAAFAGEDFHDPFEDTNRKIFDFNQVVDRHVLAPVAKAYRSSLPEPVRNSLRDFLNNLQAPLIFANDTLQGDFGRAKDTVVRFVLNSTLGMAGLVDVAGRWGIPYHEQDLGMTLGVWGIPEGPYIVVPILGPSDLRDLGGLGRRGLCRSVEHRRHRQSMDPLLDPVCARRGQRDRSAVALYRHARRYRAHLARLLCDNPLAVSAAQGGDDPS